MSNCTGKWLKLKKQGSHTRDGALTDGKCYWIDVTGDFKDDNGRLRRAIHHEFYLEEYFKFSDQPLFVEYNDSTVASTFGPLEDTGKGVKFDSGKTELSLLLQGCANAIEKVAEVLTFGAKKYTRNGWQTVDDAERRYTDALYRHMNAIHRGEELDPESGLSHRAHAACNAMFLLELDNTEV